MRDALRRALVKVSQQPCACTPYADCPSCLVDTVMALPEIAAIPETPPTDTPRPAIHADGCEALHYNDDPQMCDCPAYNPAMATDG